MALLTASRTALEECRRHLESTGSLGSPIEAYLTQHLLILLFSETEQGVRGMLRARLSAGPDPAVGRFFDSSMDQVVRGVTKAALAGVVAHFGPAHKLRFDAAISPAALVAYDNAHQARKDVAHRAGCSFAFSEMDQAVDAAEELLRAFELAIR